MTDTGLCPTCGGQREVDPVTRRCLTCGMRPSQRLLGPSASTSLPPDLQTYAGQDARRSTVRDGSYYRTVTIPPDPEPPEPTPPPSVAEWSEWGMFGSSTEKRICPCGAIIVWLTSADPPQRCHFCQRAVQ